MRPRTGKSMKRKLLAGAGASAVIAGLALSLIRLTAKPAAAETVTQAVLQIPREVMSSVPLFDPGESDSGRLMLSRGLAEETGLRLKDRNIALQMASAESDPLESLLQRVTVEVEPEAGQDRVTLTYRTPIAEEAIPVLSAITDALREIQPGASQTEEASDLAERESQLTAQIKRLEAAVTQQSADLSTSGLTDAERVVLVEQMKRLAVDLSEARRDRLESEHRLLQTRKDLENGLPVDVLISRLPGAESQESLKKLLSRPRVQEELEIEQAAYQKLTAVYGRKHPRMVDLSKKIESLQAQSKSSIVLASAETGKDSATDILLRLLAADLEERQALESDLQEQFDVKKGAIDEHAASVAMVGQMQKESTRLGEEREAARRKIVELRRRWQERAAEVIVPPGFVESDRDNRAALKSIGGTVIGICLLSALAMVWWRKPSQENSEKPKLAKKFSPLDVFREKEDRANRLAKLKNLSKNRSLASQGAAPGGIADAA